MQMQENEIKKRVPAGTYYFLQRCRIRYYHHHHGVNGRKGAGANPSGLRQ